MSEEILKFLNKYNKNTFYQPVIFDPGVLEIKGKWHSSTLDLSEQILSNIRNKTILDVGCNVGFFLFEALNKGAQSATGIDNDPEIINKLRKLQSIFKIHLVSHCIDALDYVPDKVFDVVLLLNTAQFTSNPRDCFSLYLKCSKNLYIEHDSLHEEWFSAKPIKQFESKRAGGRILSIFAGPAEI